MRIVVAFIALALAALCAAQESKVQLRDGPGKDKASACLACHSLDYIQMNARFMKRAGWEAEVKKMVSVMGAPVSDADATRIVDYLTREYGIAE